MRVNPVSFSVYSNNLKNMTAKKIETPKTDEAPAFKGGLKLPDYIAGGVCGSVMGFIIGSAIFPPLGVIAGVISGSIIAEENKNSRPSNPNDND